MGFQKWDFPFENGCETFYELGNLINIIRELCDNYIGAIIETN